MRLVFILLLLGCGITPLAQNGYSVIYEYDLKFTSSNKPKKPVTDRLVFNDSLSFWYRLPDDGKDPLRKSQLFGDKLVHHAVLFNRNTGISYSEVAFPKGKQEYLIRDSLRNDNWIFVNITKEILGYSCRPALRVNVNNDSTLVWFTDSIPQPFGPFTYFGFPGLVLEVYDQVRTRHLIATKIETGPYRVILPQKGSIISSEDFYKLKR